MADPRQRLARKYANTQSGNPRVGQLFTAGKTKSGLTFHEYAGGKRVVVKPPAVRNAPKGITSYSTEYAPRTNNVKGNPRAGSPFTTINRGGNTYHRYAEEAGGIPAEVYRVKRRK